MLFISFLLRKWVYHFLARSLISTQRVGSALFPWSFSATFIAFTPRPCSSLSLLLCHGNEGSREEAPPGVHADLPPRLLPPELPPGLWHRGQPFHLPSRTLFQPNHFMASFSLSFLLGPLPKTSLLSAELAILLNRPPFPAPTCRSGIIWITYMTWCSN